jgi:hypothetical protein
MPKIYLCLLDILDMENIEYSDWVCGGALLNWTWGNVFFQFARFLEEIENVGFCF